MQLLLLIFLVSAQVLTSNAECMILDITPTDTNDLTPCGIGSLTSGCYCCPGGQVACQELTQECTPGLLGDNYYCTENPAFVPSSVLSVSTTKTTAVSPATVVTVPAHSSSTTQNPATSHTTTASVLNSATSKTTGTTPTSTPTTHSQTPSSIGARKEHGGIRSLVAMNVFIFCWL
jgi:hypothetical protein